MGRTEFDFDDGGSESADVAGTPEGDGDFETDKLPDTGATSSGGQIIWKKEVEGVVDPQDHTEPESTSSPEKVGTLEKVIDEISRGKLLP